MLLFEYFSCNSVKNSIKMAKTDGYQIARVDWPDRDALRKTMPECFQVAFECKVAVIIDCFKIFVERPSNLEGRRLGHVFV